MTPTRLLAGCYILDLEQSVQEAERVAHLLETEVDAGPDGQVIIRGWMWRKAPQVVVCITTDN